MIYADFIRPGNLCFDVGANIGNKSQELLSKGARVVAFEPQKDCFLHCQKRFENNPNIILQNVALGKAAEDLVLKKCEASTIASISDTFITETKKTRFAAYNWNKTEIVHATTLNAMIMRYGCPVFCKIDVEGYEFEVIQGLTQKIPYISIEYTPELFNNTLKCLAYLNQISPIVCNYGHKEHEKLHFNGWMSLEEITPFIADNPLYKTDKDTFGDIYIKM